MYHQSLEIIIVIQYIYTLLLVCLSFVTSKAVLENHLTFSAHHKLLVQNIYNYLQLITSADYYISAKSFPSVSNDQSTYTFTASIKMGYPYISFNNYLLKCLFCANVHQGAGGNAKMLRGKEKVLTWEALKCDGRH